MNIEKNRKEITFLISSLSGGGAEGVCVNIANGLTERGWKVNLLVLHLNNPTYKKRLSKRVNLVPLGVNHARYSLFPLRNYIRQYKPEKVLVFNHELTVLMVLLRSMFRYKYKIIARNINTMSALRSEAENARFWKKRVVKPLVDLLYFKADHIVNQCEAMEQDLLQVYPKLKGKTSVIYNPVAKHIENYAINNKLTGVKKENYLLCVGRLEKQKAFHYAIEAFSKIISEKSSIRLKIVGEGSQERSLKQLALDLNVASKVDFEGFKVDIIPYYIGAKATLLTSLYEGFPNVLVESIALGTPVVSFDCPSGPKEIIDSKVNGCLTKYRDVEDFSKKLGYALSKQFNSNLIIESSYAFFTESILCKYDSLLLNGNFRSEQNGS